MINVLKKTAESVFAHQGGSVHWEAHCIILHAWKRVTFHSVILVHNRLSMS